MQNGTYSKSFLMISNEVKVKDYRGTVFADKLFANITTDSEDQEDTLISLLSNDGAISVFRGNWRENY